MKNAWLGVFGLVLVGCGGGGGEEKSSVDESVAMDPMAITAPVVCEADSDGNMTATFSVPGKNLLEMMQNTFVSCCNTTNGNCSKSSPWSFSMDGTANFNPNDCVNIQPDGTEGMVMAGAVIGCEWVYQP